MATASFPERTDWLRVLIILGAAVLTTFQVGKAPPSLPLMRADLRLSLFAAGWVVSLLTFVSMIGGTLAGAIADRLGHRRMIFYGLVILGLGSLAGALAPSAAILLASRFFEGLGLAVLVVAGPALLVRFTGTNHIRMVMGFWSCSVPAGVSLMMIFSSVLLTVSTWRYLWLTNAIMLFAYALFFSLWTREPTTWSSRLDENTVRIWRDIWRTVSKPGPILLGLCYGAYTFQLMGFMGFLPTLLIEDLHVGQSAAAIVAALIVASNVLGNLLSGYLLQRGVTRVVCLIAANGLMAACAFGIYAASWPDPIRVGLGFLFCGVSGMIPAALFAGTVVHAPNPSLVGTTNGLMMQGSNVGSTFGPPLVAAAVTAAGGWQVVPWVLLSAAALGILFGLALGWLERKQRETSIGTTRF
ncbi:MAG: MFS transporter [Pseudomonadota bacterium]